MTSHELANLLLKQPDSEIFIISPEEKHRAYKIEDIWFGMVSLLNKDGKGEGKRYVHIEPNDDWIRI